MAALLLTASILAAVVSIGAVHTRSYTPDIFFVLNGAWRVLNGQIPHIDFYSPFGPLIFLLVAAGLKLSSFGVEGFGYGIAIAGLLVAALGYRLITRRLPPLASVFLLIDLVLLAVTPYPLGMDPERGSHAMSYNRIGYALLALVLLESFHPARHRLDAFLAGATAVALLFLKASFFFVACPLLAISLLGKPFPKHRLAPLASGALLSLAIFLAYLRFDIPAILADLRIAAAARSGALSFSLVIDSLWIHSFDFMRLAAILFIARRHDFLSLFYALAVLGGSLLLMLTNNQGPVLPLVDVIVLLLAAAAPRTKPAIIVALLALAPAFWQAGRDVYGLVQAAMEPAAAPTLSSPHLARLHLYPYQGPSPEPEGTNGRSFVHHINDGLRLLSQHARPGETVVTPELGDPFAYAALRPPAPGGFVLLAYGYTFNDQHRPSNDRLFAGADLILLPKLTVMTGADFAHHARLFFPYIQAHFHTIAESDEWFLYRKRR